MHEFKINDVVRFKIKMPTNGAHFRVCKRDREGNLRMLPVVPGPNTDQLNYWWATARQLELVR